MASAVGAVPGYIAAAVIEFVYGSIERSFV
jgi:hypothetical protein